MVAVQAAYLAVGAVVRRPDDFAKIALPSILPLRQ